MISPAENDDPTIEEEALEFDGVHTDQLDSAYRVSVVSASESSAGGIDHDDRGQARWRWITEDERPATTDDTFDQLHALDNPTLTLAVSEQASVEAPPSKPGGGYDPYDTKPVAKKSK